MLVRAINSISAHQRIIIFAIIVFACLIRFYGLGDCPAGLNQDEASIGYETFSLAHYGIDRNGNSYPVILESWGNGQNALYAYLSIPFVKLFGLNAASVRLLSAISGSLSVLLFYLILSLFCRKRTAFIGLILITINPWSVMSSRFGLESNLLPTIILSAFFLFAKALKQKNSYLLPSFLLFALSFYAYGTAYFFTPLVLLFCTVYCWKYTRINRWTILISLAAATIVMLPIVLFIFINHFNLLEMHLGTLTIPKFTANRTTVVFNILSSDFFPILVKNSIRTLSIILLQSDSYLFNALPETGTIYHVSLLFLPFGIYTALRNRQDIINRIFLTWIACALLLGICIHANINRLNVLFFPLLFFCTTGIITVTEMLAEKYRNIFVTVILSIYSLLFIVFAGNYTFQFNEKIKNDFSYGLANAIRLAEQQRGNGSIHITEESINMPYIYSCFYTCPSPDSFYKSVRYDEKDSTGFRPVKSWGHYSFGQTRIPGETIEIVSEQEYLSRSFKNGIKTGKYYVVKLPASRRTL